MMLDHTWCNLNQELSCPNTSCINIATIDDYNVEGDQEFTVSISEVNLVNNVALHEPFIQTATLTDNDSNLHLIRNVLKSEHFFLIHNTDITVGFVPEYYIFFEQDTAVQLTLQVSDLAPGVLECDIEVTIAYNDGPKASKLLNT